MSYSCRQAVWAIESAYSKVVKELYPHLYPNGVEVDDVVISHDGITFFLDNHAIDITRSWKWIAGFENYDYYMKKTEDLYRSALEKYSK